MDCTFTCHLSYLIKFYILGLIISGVLNSYTFYQFGYQPEDASSVCPYNSNLFKQSTVAIFTGFFVAQLLVILLVIPSTTPTNSADNRNYRTVILLFLTGFIITAGLTIVSAYHFVDSRLYRLPESLKYITHCSRLYYNSVYANTILSAIPVCLIMITTILYMIGWCLDTILEKYCMTTNTRPGINQHHQHKFNKKTQTNKQDDLTPKFINPSNIISVDTDTTSIGSADEFQMDAMEINPTFSNFNTSFTNTTTTINQKVYPSWKYNYSTLIRNDEQITEDMMPLINN